MRNIKPIEQVLTASGFKLIELCRGSNGKIADIGAVDGDLAVLCEENGLLE
jgi:hypothetical protein